jgi:hypothetical protein
MTTEQVRTALGLSTEMEPFFWLFCFAGFFMGAAIARSIFWTGRNDNGPMDNTERYIISPILMIFCFVGGTVAGALGNHTTQTRHEQLAAISSEEVTVKSFAVKPVLNGSSMEEMTEVTTDQYPDRTFAVKGRKEWASGKSLTLYKYSPKGNWERSLVTEQR